MKLKHVTTGSPILDSALAAVLVAGLGFLVNRIVQIKMDYSLWAILSTGLNVPLWVLIILSCISVIAIKRIIVGPNLKEMLTRRRYRLIFNAKDGRNKELGFSANGEITVGRNDNEYSWRILGRKLEILGADGKLYSRFRYDEEIDRFYLINGPHNRSLPDQVIEPINDGVTNWAEIKSRRP